MPCWPPVSPGFETRNLRHLTRRRAHSAPPPDSPLSQLGTAPYLRARSLPPPNSTSRPVATPQARLSGLEEVPQGSKSKKKGRHEDFRIGNQSLLISERAKKARLAGRSARRRTR